MGFRLRSSVKLGLGFRINFSKTGIGYSWGVPGARFTRTASGRNRATFTLPGTGISWVSESGGRRRRPARYGQRSVSRQRAYVPAPRYQKPTEPDTGPKVLLDSVENAEADVFNAAHYEDFLAASRRYYTVNSLFMTLTITIGLMFLALYGFSGEIWFAYIFFAIYWIALIGIIILMFAMRVNVYYEQDESLEERIELIDALIKSLKGNNMIWQINGIYQNVDVKKNFGSQHSYSRTPVSITKKCPGFMRTNVTCHHIRLKSEELYILPDKLLIKKGLKVGAIDWNDLNITVGGIDYVDDLTPKDTKVVATVWQYVNKDGSRDMRYKSNMRRNKNRYGTIKFKSSQGFDTTLHLSNEQKAIEFGEILGII